MIDDALLIGSKVYLRALEIADAPILRRAVNDPLVRNTFFTSFPTNLHQQQELIKQLYTLKDLILLAIADVETRQVLGLTGFHRIDWPGRMATFSLIIANPEYWGKGAGSEATRLMISYGFDVLNFHRIELKVYVGNEAAKKIYTKIGFQEEGRLREAMYQNDQYHDFYVMGLLNRDYYKMKESSSPPPESKDSK